MKILDVRGKYGVGHTVVDDDVYADMVNKSLYAKPNGYIYFQTRKNGKLKNHYLHRHITSAEEGMDVDHKNGLRHDNRSENLRVCTRSQNMANMAKKGKGVRQENGKWLAEITLMYKSTRIGLYDTRDEAIEAYKEKSKEMFGDFAGRGEY